jgi:hypothetical protein
VQGRTNAAGVWMRRSGDPHRPALPQRTQLSSTRAASAHA